MRVRVCVCLCVCVCMIWDICDSIRFHLLISEMDDDINLYYCIHVRNES